VLLPAVNGRGVATPRLGGCSSMKAHRPEPSPARTASAASCGLNAMRSASIRPSARTHRRIERSGQVDEKKRQPDQGEKAKMIMVFGNELGTLTGHQRASLLGGMQTAASLSWPVRCICSPKHEVGHDVLCGFDHVSAVGRLASGGLRSLEERGQAVPGDHVAHEHGGGQ
jgi:hypothetical protein